MLRQPLIGPRRVLITLDAVGGVWRYALDTARGLEDFGVSCLLVGFGPEPDHRQRAECNGLRNSELLWTHEPLDWMAADAAALRPGTEKLGAAARSWAADLLHLNLPSQAAAVEVGVPVVVASHSCVPTWWDAVRGTELPVEWMWQKDLNRRGLQRADAIVVPSASHGAALRRVYGSLPPLRMIYNATAVAPEKGRKEQLILSVGRWWDSGKNGEALDKAARSLSWPMVLAGPLKGPHGESAEFSNLRTTGALSHDHVLALMRRASIFAAPSRYEPFGLAVVEAAMSGAALVLSDIPVFRELWDGTALFVGTDDVAGWSQALTGLAADETLRRSLAGRAALRAGQFNLSRQAAELHDVYARTFASVVT